MNKPSIASRYLPGIIEPAEYHDTDVASFYDVYEALIEIRAICMEHEKQVGWTVMGRDESLVVMVFRTRSAVDDVIPIGRRPLALGNGTGDGVEGDDVE